MTDKREEIMQAGRLMAQAGGYQSLSFRDIAAAVGVKSASIHYHFPTKGDLGAALAQRYSEDLAGYLATITEGGKDIATVMRAYTAIFREPLLNDNRMCMAGIMAAEHDQLPEAVRKEIIGFTELNITWLSALLLSAKAERTKAKAARRALAIFSAIEGAQLIARGRGTVASYDEAIEAYRAIGLIP